MGFSRLFLIILTFTITIVAAAFRPNASLDSDAGSLTPASPMLEPRSGQTATLLPDGKVLIAGGTRRN